MREGENDGEKVKGYNRDVSVNKIALCCLYTCIQISMEFKV
jgi:hypothetical protein